LAKRHILDNTITRKTYDTLLEKKEDDEVIDSLFMKLLLCENLSDHLFNENNPFPDKFLEDKEKEIFEKLLKIVEKPSSQKTLFDQE